MGDKVVPLVAREGSRDCGCGGRGIKLEVRRGQELLVPCKCHRYYPKMSQAEKDVHQQEIIKHTIDTRTLG